MISEKNQLSDKIRFVKRAKLITVNYSVWLKTERKTRQRCDL